MLEYYKNNLHLTNAYATKLVHFPLFFRDILILKIYPPITKKKKKKKKKRRKALS